MQPRTTGLLLLVAALLFGGIYVFAIQGDEKREQAREAEKRLFPGVEPQAVDALALTTSDDRPARLARQGEAGWRLLEPLDFPGDAFAADGIASALAELSSAAVYDEPAPPDVYGLGPGALAVSFQADGEEHTLRVGDATPLGSDTYVSVEGRPQVYTVSSFSVNALRKSLDDLRDKRIAPFDTESIQRIEAAWRGGGRVVLEKGDEGWRLVSPLEGPADPDVVTQLLTDLAFLRADGFEDAPLSDGETGLDDPELAVVLRGEGEEGGEPVEVGVAIGSVTDDGTRLVQGAAAGSLYRIPAERLDDLPRDLVSYRFKQLARFTSLDARRVELTFQRFASSAEGSEPLTIVAERGEAGWTSSPERFQPGKLAALVLEVSDLAAVEILADSMGDAERAALGLAPPSVAIAVFDADDEELGRVHLGVVRSDGHIVAQAADQPLVYALAPEAGEHLPVSLEAFRNRFRSAEEEEPEPGTDLEGEAAETP